MLDNAGVSLKIRKLQFFRKRLEYIGHVFLPRRIAIAKDLNDVVHDGMFLQEMNQIRSFLCACTVYCHFMKCFSQMVEPLNCWLGKDGKQTWLDPPTNRPKNFRRPGRVSLHMPS